MIPYGYKQTEAGVIPEDWELLLLGKTAKVYRGGSPRPIQSYITNSSNGVNWIKIGDVRENDKYIYSTQEKIRPDGISMSREVHIGDFILSNSMSFGRPYILRTNGCIHDGWLTIQEYGQAFSTEYLYYLLSSKIIYKQYIGMAAGSSVKNLNKDKVSSLMVICPPLPEQQRIAEALSDVDGMISSLEKLVAKYKSIKTACLQQMFPQNGETVPRMRLPGFTGAWEQRKLGDMMNVTSVKRIHQSDWTDSGVRFLRARDIVAAAKNEEPDDYLYISKEKYEEYSALSGKVSVSDLLVTGVGTIGVPYLVRNLEPLYFKDGNIIWFQNSDKIDGKFLFYSFSAEQIQGFINESAGIGTVGTYTIESGKKTPISLPNQIEQAKVGEFFQQLDNLITLHQRKLKKIQKIKQGMMQQLLTGKIRLL